MSTFVITDLHGNNELLRRALKTIGLKKNDKLIVLGDLIDRGPDSKGVLDTIILLQQSGFDVTCLMGNHEEMLLSAQSSPNALTMWTINGGDRTLESFFTSRIDRIPSKYFDFIKSFPTYLEVENYIFVHAALNMHISDPYSDKKTLLWERDPLKFKLDSWLGARKVIHGHTPTSNSQILEMINHSNIVCLDNGTYLRAPGFGSLCVLNLDKFDATFIK